MEIAVLSRQKLLVRDVEIRSAAQEPKLSRAASSLGRWLKCQIACRLLRWGEYDKIKFVEERAKAQKRGDHVNRSMCCSIRPTCCQVPESFIDRRGSSHYFRYTVQSRKQLRKQRILQVMESATECKEKIIFSPIPVRLPSVYNLLWKTMQNIYLREP